MQLNETQQGDTGSSIREYVRAFSRLLVAALAGWVVLILTELIFLFGVLRLFAMLIGPELLPSLKVVLDMAALAACGWIAGRVGAPRVMAAAALTAAGLAVFDLTPYFPLNVPWVLRLTRNALSEPRYVSSLLAALLMHVILFGSLFAGAHLSRPRQSLLGLGFGR